MAAKADCGYFGGVWHVSHAGSCIAVPREGKRENLRERDEGGTADLDVGRRREGEENKEGVRDDGLVGDSERLQLGKVDGREVVIMSRGIEVLETEVFYGWGCIEKSVDIGDGRAMSCRESA